MIKTAALIAGNATTISAAAFATIKGEDVRIWFCALCGLAITAAPAIYKTQASKSNARKAAAEAKAAEDRAEQERYDSMERRAALCHRCKTESWRLASCSVEPPPCDCPLMKR